MMVGTVAFATALDILNRSLGGDDDDGENRYDKIAPWVKERNLIIMLPESKGFIKLPLPWGYNVFHVMGQSIGETINKPDNDHMDSVLNVLGATVNAFNPIEGGGNLLQLLSPTLTDPVAQWYSNTDWTGRKVRPESSMFGTVPESQKYWNSVKPPSKWITNKLNQLTGGDEIRPGYIDVSPELIDLIYDTAVGGAGRFAANAVLTPLKAMKGEEEIEPYEIPILRKVYGKGGSKVLTSDYYENADSVNLLNRQIERYKTEPIKLREILKDHSKELKLIAPMKITKNNISRLNKIQDKIDLIKDDNVRKEKTVIIKDRKDILMKRFNTLYFKTMRDK